MARKVINYTVTDEGRDKGKTFVLTEMPASKGEAWAIRALLALMHGGVDLPQGVENMSMAAMAEVGINALSRLKWDVTEPLLAEMFECITVMPDPSKPHVVRALIDQDIEEIATRVKLRAEVWKLHTDFLKAVAPSISDNPVAAKRGSRNTKTSLS